LLTRCAKIRVGAIARALNGPPAPISCASVTAFRGCDHRADLMTCPARLVMVEARKAIANVLDNYTLARMRGLSDRLKIRRVRVGSIAFGRSPAPICSPAPVSHFGHWSPVGQFAG
jgi:DNA-binding IscR family transcriptional regulator